MKSAIRRRTDPDDTVVRYALNAATSPMAVAGYTYTKLPATEQATLPDEQDLRDVVAQALGVSEGLCKWLVI
jgi:hypothetical protein